ncbi:FadR family transcriptional regulator, partial [Paraburkholderia sp. BR14262]
MPVRPRESCPRHPMKNVPHTVTDAAIATIRERIEGGLYP